MTSFELELEDEGVRALWLLYSCLFGFTGSVSAGNIAKARDRVFMARRTEQLETGPGQPRDPQQSRAWQHVARVFGRQPSSVREVSNTGARPDACIFKLEWSVNQTLEFICAGGVLVAIPPFPKKKPKL